MRERLSVCVCASVPFCFEIWMWYVIAFLFTFPVQMPRGYGGVAVLWRKGLDY